MRLKNHVEFPALGYEIMAAWVSSKNDLVRRRLTSAQRQRLLSALDLGMHVQIIRKKNEPFGTLPLLTDRLDCEIRKIL